MLPGRARSASRRRARRRRRGRRRAGSGRRRRGGPRLRRRRKAASTPSPGLYTAVQRSRLVPRQCMAIPPIQPMQPIHQYTSHTAVHPIHHTAAIDRTSHTSYIRRHPPSDSLSSRMCKGDPRLALAAQPRHVAARVLGELLDLMHPESRVCTRPGSDRGFEPGSDVVVDTAVDVGVITLAKLISSTAQQSRRSLAGPSRVVRRGTSVRYQNSDISVFATPGCQHD